MQQGAKKGDVMLHVFACMVTADARLTSLVTGDFES